MIRKRKRKRGIRVILKICLFYVILFLKCWGVEVLENLKGNLPWYLENEKERKRRLKQLRKIKREMRKKWKDRLS